LLANPKVSLTLLMMLFASGMLMVVATALGYMCQTPSADQLKQTVTQSVIDKAQQMANIKLPPSAVDVSLDPTYHYGNGFGMLAFATHLGIWAGIVSMIFGPSAGILARRFGARVPALIAGVVMIGCGIAFALITPHYTWQAFGLLNGVFGIAFGLLFASASIMIVDALPEIQQGIGSGMLGVTIGIGGSAGSAVMAAFQSAHPLKATVVIKALGQNVSQPIPGVYGDQAYTYTFFAMTGLAVIALIVAIVMRHGRTPTTAGVVH
jgi:MFS family permease